MHLGCSALPIWSCRIACWVPLPISSACIPLSAAVDLYSIYHMLLWSTSSPILLYYWLIVPSPCLYACPVPSLPSRGFIAHVHRPAAPARTQWTASSSAASTCYPSMSWSSAWCGSISWTAYYSIAIGHPSSMHFFTGLLPLCWPSPVCWLPRHSLCYWDEHSLAWVPRGSAHCAYCSRPSWCWADSLSHTCQPVSGSPRTGNYWYAITTGPGTGCSHMQWLVIICYSVILCVCRSCRIGSGCGAYQIYAFKYY